MGSTRAGGVVAGGATGRGADLVAAAAALRWARPDLTAALADHVLEEASAAGEQERWLAAAGWAVHARATTGDGREIACEVLDGLGRWDASALSHPAARRLRIELAMVAAGSGEVDAARQLVAPVVVDDGDPELLADLRCVRARCAVEDAPDEVAEAIGAAGAAWELVDGAAGELGGASVALIGAVVERRAGRPAVAVDRAAEGLGRLDRARAVAGTPSGHLGAALAAEWISALLDADRAAEARDGCAALLPRLSEQGRPTRQLALLRLTVARVLAAQDEAADTTELLEQAGEDAAAGDVPDLEAVCRTALGALHEKAERLDTALATLQLAVTAERRDRARSRRFAAALAELPSSTAAERAPTETRAGDSATTTVLPAITRGDRKLARSRWEELLRAEGRDEPEVPSRSRFERMPEGEPGTDEGGSGEPAAGEDTAHAWGAVPWNGSMGGDSPIGDLLIRSMRHGPAEPADEHGPAHRNGRTPGRRAVEEDPGERPARRSRRRSGRAPDAGDAAGATGWVPAFDASPSDERPARRHGARADSRPDDEPPVAGRGRRRSREEPDATQDDRAHVDRADGDRIDAEEPSGRRRAGGSAPRRRARAERDPGDGQAERNGSGGRHGRPGEARPGDSPRRARRETDTGAQDDPAGTDAQVSGRGAGRAEQPVEDVGRASTAAGGGHAADGDPPAEPAGAAAPVNGRRHRADDPWATGRWMMGTAGRREAEHAAEHAATEPVTTEHPTTEHPTTGLPTTGPTTGSAGEPAVSAPGAIEQPAVGPDSPGGDSDSWLQAALADLDRVLGSTSLPSYRDEDPGPAETGCSVVIDVARDGRRFAGRRSQAVVRSIADRLDGSLPPGAHQHFGDSDTLLISGPGWSRVEATGWMHRTLPGLLDGFVTEEDLPGAQLRAAVHDADGPVGAQILQNLARPSGRPPAGSNGRAGSTEHEPATWSDLRGRSSEARGREHGTAGRSARRDRADAPSRSRRDGQEDAGRRSPDDDPPGWPWAGGEDPQDGSPQPVTAHDEERAPRTPAGADVGAGTGRHDGSRRSSGRSIGETRPDGTGDEGSGAGDADRGTARSRDAGASHEGAGAGRPRGERAGGRRRRRREAGQDEPVEARPVDSEPLDIGRDDTVRSTPAERAETAGTARGEGPGQVRDAAGSGGTATGHGGSAGDGADAARPEDGEPAEGLGIADLLAGALAAYRGI